MKEYLCPALHTLFIPQGKCNILLSKSHINISEASNEFGFTVHRSVPNKVFSDSSQDITLVMNLKWKEEVFSEFAKEYYSFQESPTIT